MRRIPTVFTLLMLLAGCVGERIGGAPPALTIGQGHQERFVRARLADGGTAGGLASDDDVWFLDGRDHNASDWPSLSPQWRQLEPHESAPVGVDAELVAEARAEALNVPVQDGFIGATVVYPYVLGQVYKVHTAPGAHTTLELAPGEDIQELIAGDTVTWVFSDTVAGIGPGARPLVFVKPIRSGQQTNLTIVTTQRLYQLDLESNPSGQYTTQVSWRYPEQGLRRLAGTNRRDQQDQTGTKVNLGTIAFTYRVETIQGRAPAWQPEQAFHDGAKTYIRFPESVTTRPPLFVVRADAPEVVNYRAQGPYYVVDTVLDVAELRLGEDRQTIVRLTRQGT